MLSTQISEEKRLLLDHLAESERSLMAAAATVPEECATVSPGEGCWSVLGVVEHITLSDRGMWKRYLNAGPNAGSINLNADKSIQEVGRDRNLKLQAPDHVHPAGRFASLAEGLREYRQTRAEIAAFIEGSSEDFRRKLVQHPVAEMDGHQLFLLIAAHSDRHAMQIEEIKKSSAYRAALNQKAAS
jgi:DinB superfamily